MTRRWPSLYEAFEDGRIERRQLQEVFVDCMPQPVAGQRRLGAIDASGIARPQSKTSADRTALHVPNLPESCTPPITVGWQFSTLVVVPWRPSSWSYVLDSLRISSDKTAGQVAVEQWHEIVALLPEGVRPLLLGDRYYPSAPFLRAIGPLPLDSLLRGIRNRVFYRPAPAPTGKRGAPRKDGERFACHEESTHGEPDAQWEGCDEQGQHLRGERWDHLHLKQAREVDLSVYRLTRLDAPQTARRPRVSWFIWLGMAPLPLAEVWSTSQCRYGIEHGYRFEKQQLLWDQPHLRTPEQFERWTQIVAAAHNLLGLARPLVEAIRQQMASARHVRSLPNRYAGIWRNFLPPWAHPLARPNRAENRQDGQKARRSRPLSASRWSKKASPRQKSGANRRNAFCFGIIRSGF